MSRKRSIQTEMYAAINAMPAWLIGLNVTGFIIGVVVIGCAATGLLP